MNLSFKEADKNGLDKLADLASEIWHEFFPIILSDEQIDYMVDKFQSKNAMLNQIEHENYKYYFIIIDNEISGYFGISFKDDYLFLSKLYLKKEFRHKGFGSKAFEKIKSIAQENNYTKIVLTVNKYNSNTIKAYLKYGFKNVSSAETDIGNGFIMDDYIMEYSA